MSEDRGKFVQKSGSRAGNTIDRTRLSRKQNEHPPIWPARPYYRILSGHMEFRVENSPVQEIANDLNVGAVRKDRKSHGPSCDGWTLTTL